MRLYRPDAVKAGRAQQDLYATLQDAIDEARQEFQQTFVAASKTMADYFHLELVRTLANDNAAWLPERCSNTRPVTKTPTARWRILLWA